MTSKKSSKKASGKKSSGSASRGGQDVHICFDRIIPEEFAPARTATERARLDNITRSMSSLDALDATTGVAPVLRMAIINGKIWQKGSTLKCRFLDGGSYQRKKVEQMAHKWEEFANIKLKFVASGDAEIRISFQADPGSWSAIGTDALVQSYFPKFQPTMNFGWLRDNTPDKEYERVVVHEFGHALGCIHEHQSPSEKLDWNVDAVYRYFSGPPNYWSKQDIDRNVLKAYAPQGITFSVFDPKSIMLYQFDGKLFKSGKGTPSNTQMSDTDKQMIARLYPKK